MILEKKTRKNGEESQLAEWKERHISKTDVLIYHIQYTLRIDRKKKQGRNGTNVDVNLGPVDSVLMPDFSVRLWLITIMQNLFYCVKYVADNMFQLVQTKNNLTFGFLA